MLSTNLAVLLKPYKLLANKHALSPTYRCLQFTPGKVVGCSAAAILETKCDHGIEAPVCVDAGAFLAVMDSLPDHQEVKMSVAGDGVLAWSCGSAKGRMAPMIIEDMPSIPTRRAKAGSYKPGADLVQALRLGSLSGDSNSLLSVGMFGVVLDNREGALVIHSSDNVTISACSLDIDTGGPAKFTLTPEPAELLATIIMPGEGTLTFDDGAAYYADKHVRALIKSVPDLRFDALELLTSFELAETVAPLSMDAIHSFVKRAGALAENKRHTYIALAASKGQISLEFNEGVASAEEFYLVDKLDVPDLGPIYLDAAKLTRALAHTTEVVLDYADRNTLIFRGSDPDFQYVIGGRTEAKG